MRNLKIDCGRTSWNPGWLQTKRMEERLDGSDCALLNAKRFLLDDGFKICKRKIRTWCAKALRRVGREIRHRSL